MIQRVTAKQACSFYINPIETQARYKSLVQKFKERFKCQPECIARAPGRVNLIGEHIDYQGYGVLPAAIDKDCLIVFKRVKSETIEISHVYGQLFPDCIVSKHPEKIWQDIPHSYVKFFAAGYRAGLLGLIEEQKIVGLQIMIEGNLPYCSGISSSASFLICSAMIAHYANRVPQMTKQDFVERCIKFERQIGTACGGMDHSISILGKKGCCLYIQFNPIRVEKVQVPLDGYKIVVTNSLVESSKVDTALFCYNKRVCECRLALHILAKKLGIDNEIYKKWKFLEELQTHMQLSELDMLPIVEKHLQRKNYTKEQLKNLLQVDLLSVVVDIQRANEVLEANKEFKLYEPAYHVYSKANRVREFIKVSRSDMTNKQKVPILGEIMNQGQYSCRDLYDCSCPELEELTQLARKNGALGSRLTGAGWGGCAVSIVPAEIEHEFIEKMIKEYYEKPDIKKRVNGIHNCIFATEPGQGAFVVDLLL